MHLLGYDHAEPAEEKEMFALQGRLLEQWYEELREAQRRAELAARDARLLGKTGFAAPEANRSWPGDAHA